MKNNKILDSTTIYSGKIFDVVKQNVQLPNGKTTDRDLIVHGGASAILPVFDDGRILLVRQFREATGTDILEIPAGRLDIGEDPEVCAIRELREETGYNAQNMRLLIKYFPCTGYSTEILYIYLAEGLSPGKANLDEDEFVSAEIYPQGELIDMIQSGDIIDSKTILAILHYKLYINGIN